MKGKLSVVLATYNEEQNLRDCLESVKSIADEIVIVDGTSSDNTVEIAEKYDAKVIIVENQKIFHINKQKALEQATNEWILQLDADERVSTKLAHEIKKVIGMTESELDDYQKKITNSLFTRHQGLLEKRDGAIGTKEGNYVAFFVPRLNYFLGTYLRFGGVYPDGVIRLVKKGHARFPAKDVHEQIAVSGRVGWLENDLLHMADPTFARYIQRNNRYVALLAQQLKEEKIPKNLNNFIKYIFVLPVWWFLLTYIRHKGFLDLWQGFVFSLFSALRFPKAYRKYLTDKA